MIENGTWYQFEIKKMGADGNMEIDYDELANAMVRAIEQVKNNTPQHSQPERIGFWKSIWGIICGKRQGTGEYTARFMATIMCAGLNALATIGLVTLIMGIVVVIEMAIKMNWCWAECFTNIAAILVMLSCLVIVAVYSLIFRGAANDIKYEEDRNYIVAVFSGIVSFVALIISIIALYRGGCGC